MHFEQYVVAVTDSNGKAYREFDPERISQGRKSKVYIPFDSEYKILIKNNSDRRAKLTIDLDGTSISGIGGLIMAAHTNEYIERFVDVAKKFRFVRKNDERVSDPTNGENGILKIRIEKEYVPYTISTYPPNPTYIYTIPAVYPMNTPNPVWNTQMCGGAGNNAPMGGNVVNYSCSSIETKTGGEIKSLCNFNSSVLRGVSSRGLNKSLLNEETGATVEGGNSSQTFGSTTWNGTDGVTYEFIFKLLGQQGVSDQERLDYQKYLELKKKFEG